MMRVTIQPQGSIAAIALEASRISDEGGWVAITLPKCLLVLTRAEFVEGLKRGKAYRCREALRGWLDAGAERYGAKDQG
jgi:hypothetical protein